MQGEQDKAFARKAIEAGVVTKEAVADCLNIQKRIVEMGLMEKSLKEILLEKRYISEEDVARIDGIKDETQKVVRIGGYEVISRLGKGQMGRVYKARQTSTNRVVALKVLPSSLSKDKDYLDRFMREAKAASKVNHPNIVSALGFGESEGLHYYAMEFVDGVNVRRILEEEGKIGEREALAIALQIATALEYAHSLSIIHRDIKPENIMLTQDGTAKLCDLGLAREISEDSSLTQFGTVLGTPYYISPEQARGEKNPDIRTDIYSLGATLFHMVTGRVPFTGTSIATILAKHITQEAPFASEVNPQVSPAASRLIKKMMEKNPRRRFQNPTELVEEIDRILSGSQTGAAPAPRRLTHRPALSRAAHAPRSQTSKTVPLAVVAVAAVILIVVILSLSGGSPRKESATLSDVVEDRDRSVAEPPQPRRTEQVRQPVAADQTRPVRMPESEERLREITQFANEKPAEVARIAQKYREFIENETNMDTVKKARGVLEAFAAKNLISLQNEIAALSASGDYHSAIGKVEEFQRIFAKTESAQRAAEMKNSLTETLQSVFYAGLKEAKQLMEKGEFENSLAAISALVPPTQKEQDEIERFRGELKTRTESAQEEKLAAIAATRDNFFAEVKKLISLFQFAGAVSLCEERLEMEEESEPRAKIADLKRDLEIAAATVEKAKTALSKMVGSRVSLKLKKTASAQGELKEVTAAGVVLEEKSIRRTIFFLEFAQEEFVRLVEQSGTKNPDTYIALGTFILLAYDDSAYAQKMFDKAKALGGKDLSQLEEKVQSTLLKERFEEANTLLNEKKFIESAKAFSLILSEFTATESLKTYKEQIEQKINQSLSESGILSVFKGKVSLTQGRFTVSYDFSDPKQWEDFSDYAWSEKIGRRESQWVISDGALIGRGSEGIIWKGIIKGDVSLELAVKPLSPQEACFYLRLCDDGKAAEGRSYSFGFGFKQPIYKYVRKGNEVVAEIVGYEPQENLIMKLKSRKFTYLTAKIPQPTIRAGETYKIRIEREGDRLRSFANNSPVADIKDSDFTKGAVSLKVVNSDVQFDDMKITGDFDPSWLAKAIKDAKKE